jgi:hypothetical protein
MTGDTIFTIIREGSCMGFIPLSGQYTVVEEATLRMVCKVLYYYRKETFNFVQLENDIKRATKFI